MSELSYREKLGIVLKLVLQKHALSSIEPAVERVAGEAFIIFERQKQEFADSKTMIFSIRELDLISSLNGIKMTKNSLYDSLDKLRAEKIIDYRLVQGELKTISPKGEMKRKTKIVVIEIPCALIQSRTHSGEEGISGSVEASVGVISRIMANNDIPSKECAVRLELDPKHSDLYMCFVKTAHKKKLKHFNYGSAALNMLEWLLHPDNVGKQIDISNKKKELKYVRDAKGLGQQIIPDNFSKWRDLFIEATGRNIRLYRDVTYGRLNTFGFELEKMEKEVFDAKR